VVLILDINIIIKRSCILTLIKYNIYIYNIVGGVNMEDLRKEIKDKFNNLTVIELGLIQYYLKLNNIDRVKEILREVQ